ncbi:MAG: MerR family transcriptional regulator [Actinomycetia bacterium]|nr:MerR family transcriptional regulator [Actinomycetes bacterium]
MATFRVGQAAELLGVSADTVRRWGDEGLLAVTRTSAGHREVDGKDLARFLEEHATTYAADVTVKSARNSFTGVVTKVQREGLVAVVEIHAGQHRFVSLMTSEAIEDLALEVGDLAVAVVKSTNVIVEKPRSDRSQGR